ncbi:urea ABC transporter ATP-binding protein UrtD [Agrobacterium tumefaciens]|uniref:urea ABC transporter ATP-binding protein UrtD n=1 Tax=Agrobacterium tumefaciens TaxID=358 RepID=UPI00287E86E1|nr:urea ABC transporter ATP-binding protein UrtD [Agrobacterium tumefaciens]MDS7595453.1 urea ABC transporter ATP-binding protein UrtD [Agrobacterium tumefaciens]
MGYPTTHVSALGGGLAIQGLGVTFGGFRAVEDLNLDIAPNELRVVIGPNGAGKTTLLDMICGKTRPTSGSIKFGGLELTGMAEHEIVRAGVGRKFQAPSVYEELTVAENLEISLPNTHGLWQSVFYRRTSETRRKVTEVADRARLTPQLSRRAGELSHGQKQWLEIAMLLLQDSRLLLLDEPVAGMSPRERELTGELLREIAADRTLIVIEHDMEFVASIASKVTVLHQGRILSEGSAEEVQRDPRVVEVYLGDSHHA